MPFETYSFPEFGESYLRLAVPGGPEVYLIPKERSQIYALLQIPFGSIDTVYRIGGRVRRIPRGAAHFLEHKLFANEDGHDSLELLGQLGANGNAYTSAHSTCYLFSCREHLAESLGELLRFVSRPYFTEQNMDAERSVIAQEIAMYEDSPATALYYLAVRAMYERHPLRDNICGTPASIAKLTPKSLHEIYKSFYHPCRWRLFLSGRIAPEEIEAIVSEYAVQGMTPEAMPRALPDEPLLPVKREVSRRMNVHQPLFALGLKLPPPSSDPEQNAREALARDIVLAALLGKSGALHESLYARGLIHSQLGSTVESMPGASYLLINGESDRPDEVLDEITRVLAETAEHGLPAKDFERMRRVAYADFLASLDSTEELAEGFCSSLADGLDLFSLGRILGEIDADFAKELFRRDFDPARLVRARILPKRKNRNGGNV